MRGWGELGEQEREAKILVEGMIPIFCHEGDVSIHVLLQRARLSGGGLDDIVELRHERAEEARRVDEEEYAVDLRRKIIR